MNRIITIAGVCSAIVISGALSVIVNAEISQEQYHQEVVANVRANVAAKSGNPAVAVEIWQELASMGNAQGMLNLGLALKNGEGVKQNPASAIPWLQAAADQGDPLAIYQLYLCFRDGIGVKPDAKRVELYRWEAAAAGAHDGQYEFGRYLLSQGREKQAAMWLQRAANGGVSAAGDALAGIPSDAIPTYDESWQKRVLTFLQEQDSALNTRDSQMALASFSSDSSILLRTPGDQAFSAISPEDYQALWQSTFDATERFRAHRWHIEMTRLEDSIQVETSTLEYMVGDDFDQKLELFETYTLADTPRGLKVRALKVDVKLRADELGIGAICSPNCQQDN